MNKILAKASNSRVTAKTNGKPKRIGRPKGIHTPVVYFRRVKEAREVLRDKALEILKNYLDTVNEARAAGEFEVATESLRWLMEHMPEDEGERMLDISVDKPKQIEQKTAPQIRIGIALGGIGNQPKELPPAVIVEDIDGS